MKVKNLKKMFDEGKDLTYSVKRLSHQRQWSSFERAISDGASLLKYERSPFNLLAITLPIVFLHGCIGIGALGIGDRSSPTGSVLIFPSKSILVHKEDQPLMADYVRSQWGEPNHRKQIDGGGEIWEYRGETLRWHGLVPMILLPLPLVVPFGHDYVTFMIGDPEWASTVNKND